MEVDEVVNMVVEEEEKYEAGLVNQPMLEDNTSIVVEKSPDHHAALSCGQQIEEC